MLVFLNVVIAGLQCISVLPAVSSCKVVVFVVLRTFLTAFICKKMAQLVKYYSLWFILSFHHVCFEVEEKISFIFPTTRDVMKVVRNL